MSEAQPAGPVARAEHRLSVIIIARNEAANLPACLASVAFADEIIVVDGGSEDDTAAVARAAGARVVIHADWPGFGPQKNRALALARGRWVLSIDADERVPPALATEIEQALERADHSGWALPRRTRFLGQWIRHCGWTPDYVLRLFRRGEGRFSDALVHERLELGGGSVGRLRTPLDHDSYPDLASYWRKTQQYAQLWAAQHYAAGRRVSVTQAVLSGLTTFVRGYVWRRGFLDGRAGLVLCVLMAVGAFMKYVSLMDMWRLAGNEPERT